MTSRTFNDAFGDLIRHLKFQMRKVLETRNSNQATRLSAGRAWVSEHETSADDGQSGSENHSQQSKWL